MGCSSSVCSSPFDRCSKAGGAADGSITLPSSGIRFTQQQLCALNQQMAGLARNDEYGSFCSRDSSSPTCGRDVMERLLQRILVGVAYLDDRFACKYLVDLQSRPETSVIQGDISKLRYLVRLDALSSPSLYGNSPTVRMLEGPTGAATGITEGCALAQVLGGVRSQWAEFIDDDGLLLRNKVQRHFACLLSLSAGSDVIPPNSPLIVDESITCGAPGKVVSPAVLNGILRDGAGDAEMFLGEDHVFPDPRHFRIAIVEDVSGAGVRLRMYPVGGQGEDTEVLLVLGIELEQWPRGADYPARIPLGHPDCLLHYKASMTGCYLVACDPVNHRENSTIWSIWLPGAEDLLGLAMPLDSTAGQIRVVLRIALHVLRGTTSVIPGFGLRAVSSYMLTTLLLWRLESSWRPLDRILATWKPQSLSRHVLCILDDLVHALKVAELRSYFFPNVNLLANKQVSRDDVTFDKELVTSYLSRLHDESSANFCIFGNDGKTAFHNTLIGRWGDVIEDMTMINKEGTIKWTKPGCGRGQGGGVYSRKQMLYLKELLKSLLDQRQYVVEDTEFSTWRQGGLFSPALQDDPVEDLVYLLSVIFDLAKDEYLSENKSSPCSKATKRSISYKRKKQLRLQYDASAAFFLSVIRRELSNQILDMKNDDIMIWKVLQLLHRAADMDVRHLGVVLDPFLHSLYQTSLENSMLHDYSSSVMLYDEIKAFKLFSKMVIDKVVTPGEGLIDAKTKGWIWATQLLDCLAGSGKEGLLLIFISGHGDVQRYHLTNTRKPAQMKGHFSFRDEKKRHNLQKNATLPASFKREREYGDLVSAASSSLFSPRRYVGPVTHTALRRSSPFSILLEGVYTRHARNLENLTKAFVALNKYSILQEAAGVLSDDERLKTLDAIHKISRESRRQSARQANRRASCPPQFDPGELHTERVPSYTLIDSCRKPPSIGLVSHDDLRQEQEMHSRIKGSPPNLLMSCHSARLKDAAKQHGGLQLLSKWRQNNENDMLS